MINFAQLPKGRGAQSDGADTNLAQAPVRQLTSQASTLIIYFSRSGNTEAQAQLASDVLRADRYELVVQQPYPANYAASVARATEERESQQWPIFDLSDFPSLDQYQLILLGHPIWAMTPANPMYQFLAQMGQQLANKRVASFSTNAGYGAGDTQIVLNKLTPASTRMLPNYTVHDIELAKTTQAFKQWLQKMVIVK